MIKGNFIITQWLSRQCCMPQLCGHPLCRKHSESAQATMYTFEKVHLHIFADALLRFNRQSSSFNDPFRVDWESKIGDIFTSFYVTRNWWKNYPWWVIYEKNSAWCVIGTQPFATLSKGIFLRVSFHCVFLLFTSYYSKYVTDLFLLTRKRYFFPTSTVVLLLLISLIPHMYLHSLHFINPPHIPTQPTFH